MLHQDGVVDVFAEGALSTVLPACVLNLVILFVGNVAELRVGGRLVAAQLLEGLVPLRGQALVLPVLLVRNLVPEQGYLLVPAMPLLERLWRGHFHPFGLGLPGRALNARGEVKGSALPALARKDILPKAFLRHMLAPVDGVGLRG